ncbi:MAG: hypothetical protein U9R50_08025, partial [Campylobacterota bacterium]|nr:hypothetical protein [Campylobacterota bacterium]
MANLYLTSEEMQQLKHIHKYTYNNSMKENRIRVILAYNEDIPKDEIKKLFLLDLKTIRRYINDFIQYRMDSI